MFVEILEMPTKEKKCQMRDESNEKVVEQVRCSVATPQLGELQNVFSRVFQLQRDLVVDR